MRTKLKSVVGKSERIKSLSGIGLIWMIILKWMFHFPTLVPTSF